MKLTANVLKVGALGVAMALVAAASAQAEVGKAVVKAVRGTASYTDGGSGWENLKVGKILKPGAKVKTEANSQVDLFLDQNGPVVRVTEGTTLGLDKLNFEATGADTVIETQLDLTSGRILGNVKKMAAASTYKVKTLVGVAGIRGTQYDISANGLTRVYQGSVVLSLNGQTGTQVVNTGEQFNPAGGNNNVTIIPPQQLIDGQNQMPTGNGGPGPGPGGPSGGPNGPAPSPGNSQNQPGSPSGGPDPGLPVNKPNDYGQQNGNSNNERL